MMTKFRDVPLVNHIPFVDVREGGPIAHALSRPEAAAALRDYCVAPMPSWGRGVCLTSIDRLAERWLKSSISAYRDELQLVATILGFPGTLTLNMSYLFACTTSASLSADGRPMIRRTLDWPFGGLGRCVEIAWQAGPAGEFYNATWPGAVGVLSATAPGRFCAVINQAPMRRRAPGLLALPLDASINIAQALLREDGWPPDHLLRYAFETCETFEDAIRLLSQEPLARPAIFTLAGVAPEEIAVVERTEREAHVMRGPVIVANDWQTPRRGWKGRMGPQNNEDRRRSIAATRSDAERFSWVIPPVLNPTTRLAVEMSASAGGKLVARGYETACWRNVSKPATRDFDLSDANPVAA
ncbi:hypothetical protein [Methylocystis bryophila]|uniref:hypothetical protein n=2 Tax=Methylocystis bryophila TaxID=655015 RepID=UPI00249307EF|nr:hypothetical protein [Methylocystis bryophila]BDV40210.1 hypothetical protein DSM21852_34630 [Methylocystis bryophila]